MKLKPSKVTLPTVVFCLCVNFSFAQSIAAESVNSASLKFNQSFGSLTFTVGELVVAKQTDTQGNSLSNGFTPSATLTSVSLQALDPSLISFNVFPNPSNEIIYLSMETSAIEPIFVSIYDLQGREIYSSPLENKVTNLAINTGYFLKGVYILNVRNYQKQLLGSYKIVKK